MLPRALDRRCGRSPCHRPKKRATFGTLRPRVQISAPRPDNDEAQPISAGPQIIQRRVGPALAYLCTNIGMLSPGANVRVALEA